MNGYNFTERVRKVLALARQEAVALNHEYVGTEHELLGIIDEGEGVAATVLQNLGIDLADLRESIIEVVKPGTRRPSGPDLPYTSRAKKTLELAMSEARERDNGYVGTEHLLMGLLREEKGIAAQTLTYIGVSVENARAEIARVLGSAEDMGKIRPAADANTLRPTSIPRTTPQYAERLRSIISASYDVAVRQKSREVTLVHATIALLEHRQGMANAILDSLALNRADALTALHQLAPAGTEPIGPEQVLTPSHDFSHVIGAIGAKTKGAFVFGTHHLLLMVLQSSPEVAGVFEQQNIPYSAVRETLGRMSG